MHEITFLNCIVDVQAAAVQPWLEFDPTASEVCVGEINQAASTAGRTIN